jgi:hypothetical protein
MSNILLLAVSLFLLQGTFARSYTPSLILNQTTNLNFITFPQSPSVPGNMVKKKMTLKERIVLKFFKKKNDPNKKNGTKQLGLFALILIGLGVLFIFITVISDKEALLNLAFAGGIIFILGIILGIIALILLKKKQSNER